jgi:hypothetical protein
VPVNDCLGKSAPGPPHVGRVQWRRHHIRGRGTDGRAVRRLLADGQDRLQRGALAALLCVPRPDPLVVPAEVTVTVGYTASRHRDRHHEERDRLDADRLK